MVSNYIDNKCKYDLNRLVNVVYLISEDAVKDIRIDNGDAYIASISQSPIEIKCYGIKLTEDETFDERYKFTHKLTFSVDGYSNHNDLQDRYYVIVKDEDGTYWMLNPLFPCKVTYTYNLGYNEDHTDFTLATVSNHPMLEVRNFTVADVYECKAYRIGGIDKLWLNEKRYTVHSGNSIKYTNDGFKKVDFKKTSPLLTETFNGDNISHAIKFNIGFDNYKTSWHYNLLEFIDNTYASVIKTKNNEYTLCGFSYGMQPSCAINADDTLGNPNHIEITLTDSHDVGDTLDFYDSVTYEYLGTKTWEYTSKYSGYMCVSEGFAKYLLKKQVDALGNETGYYMVHEGYRSLFNDLNLVEEEFSEDVLFTNVECGGMECRIDSSIPSTVVFNNKNCKTYYLKSDTPWTATSSSNHITLSPSTGAANVEYDVRICNSSTPTATAKTSTITLNYCNSAITYNVSVVENDDCLPQGRTYNISANAQTLTIPTRCCVESVRETIGVGSIINVYSNSVTVQVPENNTGSNRTISLLAVYCNGKSANIIINQSNVFERWVDDGNICKKKDKYLVQVKYTGTTSSSMTARTDEIKETLIERNSDDCHGTDDWNNYKYVIVEGEYFCDDANKYALERKYVTDDNTNWFPTDIYRKSTVVLEYNSTDCCYDPKWENYPYSKYQWDGDTVCNDGSKWKYYKKYFSMDGVTWEESCIMKLGTTLSDLVELNSEDCGYIPNGNLYRWRQSSSVNDYICSGTTKYYKVIYEESTDSGSTWHTAIPMRIMLGDVIEYDSLECSSNASRFKVSDMYICSSYDESTTNDFRYKVLDSNGNVLEMQECNGNNVLKSSDFSQDLANMSTSTECTLIVGECISILDLEPIQDTSCSSCNTFFYRHLVLPKNSLVELIYLSGWYGNNTIVIPKTVKRLGVERDGIFVDGVNSSGYLYFRLSAVTFEEGSRLEAMGRLFYMYGSNYYTRRNTVITSFEIPSGVTEIPNNTFYSASSLTDITIPSGVTSIGTRAFYGCRSITSVTIDSGSTLDIIGADAFMYCSGITSFAIPATVRSIGNYAFCECRSLSSITFDNNSSLINLGYYALSGTAMNSITLPQSVESIDNTFGFTSNQTVIIPQNSNLKRMNIAVSAIDRTKYTRLGGAFPNNLQHLQVYRNAYVNQFGYVFGSKITVMKQVSYSLPTNADITVMAAYPPFCDMIPSNFRGTIRVPASSVELYKNDTYWYQFADYIIGY